MSSKRPGAPVVMTTRSFVSLGLVCTLCSAAFNVGVTWMRVSSLESVEQEHTRRIGALEAITAAHTTEVAVITTELTEIDKSLARIDGRLSGFTTPAKARQ